MIKFCKFCLNTSTRHKIYFDKNILKLNDKFNFDSKSKKRQ